MAWQPEPRHDTVAWFSAHEPELLARWARQDTGWGFDYEPAPLIHLEDRDALENELTDRGHSVVRVAGLAELYLDDPGEDAFGTVLAALFSAGGPR